MWNELTDIPIQQIVTIVACENGELQTVIEKPEFYRQKLESVIEQFNKIQLNEVKYQLPNSFSSVSASTQNRMIDVQCEIQKLQADLEFHEQKIRLTMNELEVKQTTLSNLLRRAERLRRIGERSRRGGNDC